MKTKALALLLALVTLASLNDSLYAALNAKQRKELSQISRDLTRASSFASRKKFDEAKKLVDSAEERLVKLSQAAMLKPTDKILASKNKLIASIRKRISGGGGKPGSGGVSFSKDVAPILAARCGNCHGNRASGQLRLDTFANMKRGGRSGALLVVGNANNSLLMARLTGQGGAQRMPRGGQPLSNGQIQLIARWINEGAKFDANDESAALSSLGGGSPDTAKPKPAAVVAKATGDEKVSFKNDIAPELVTLCVRCHSGNNPRGGLSMNTFEDLMRGGDSGRVLLPGNKEGSRMFRLVGAREQPRMPQGQGRITRKWWADFNSWIEEGIKYDGGDPKTPLRQLVPTDDEKKAMELAMLTPDEFANMRETRTEEQWKRVAPKERTRFVRGTETYVYGNAGAERMEEINGWAESYASRLKKMFRVSSTPMFKGRLAVVVFSDRFGYTEWHQTIHNRGVPKSVTGHSVVVPSMEDAYVVLEDVSDDVSDTSPGLHANLVDHMTGAYLVRSGQKLPDWVIRGTGLAMAAQVTGSSSEYFKVLKEDAYKALQTVENPNDIFADGKFSPTEVGPIGFTLVDFMLKKGSGPKFGQFITALQSGSNVSAALKSTYNADAKAIAAAYAQSFQKK
ncbi:MAG: hypothetical protein CMJ78_01300 [Planctomycetaceae bacterium]|nr:hypothetical protein [Planctomycetaceae bacterium]